MVSFIDWFENCYCNISVITYITVELLFACNKGIVKQAMSMRSFSHVIYHDAKKFKKQYIFNFISIHFDWHYF